MLGNSDIRALTPNHPDLRIANFVADANRSANEFLTKDQAETAKSQLRETFGTPYDVNTQQQDRMMQLAQQFKQEEGLKLGNISLSGSTGTGGNVTPTSVPARDVGERGGIGHG